MDFSEYGGKFRPEQEATTEPIDVFFDQVVDRFTALNQENQLSPAPKEIPAQIRQRLRQEYPWKEIRYLLSLQATSPELITLDAINSTILSTSPETIETTELAKSAIITLLVNTVAQGRFDVARLKAREFVENYPANADILLGVISNEQTLNAPPEFFDSIIEIIKNSGTADQKSIEKALKRAHGHTEKTPAERLQKIVQTLTNDANSAFAQDLPEFGERFVDLATIIDPDFDEQTINRSKKETRSLSSLDAPNLIERLKQAHPNNLNERRAIIEALRRFGDDPKIARIIEQTEADISSTLAARAQAAAERQEQAKKIKNPTSKQIPPPTPPRAIHPQTVVRPTYPPIAEMGEIKDLIRAGFTGDAKRILKPIALANPDHPEILLLVAYLALAEKDVDTARSVVDRLQGRVNPIEQRRLSIQLSKAEREATTFSRQSAKGTVWSSLGAREPINRTAYNVTREPKFKDPKEKD